MYAEYLDIAIEKIRQIQATQDESIRAAAELVAQAIMTDHLIYTFGSGHSALLAREIRGRAGGLYPILQINDPMEGRAEKIEGFGTVLVQYQPLKAGDVLFVISNSGRNPEPIEVAMCARQKGVKVIVLTSMEHTRSVTSRHSSGKLLYELGEVVLDNMVPAGDAAIAVPGLRTKTGAFSTVLGSLLLNAVVIEAIAIMQQAGFDSPVLLSANLDGSDEYNTKIAMRYAHLPADQIL